MENLDSLVPTSPQLPLLLTIEQVAATLGFAVQTLRHWTHSTRRPPTGWPKPVHIGRNVRYRSDDIVRWIEAGCRQTKVEHVSQPVVAVSEPQPQKRGRGRPRKTW